MYESTGTAISLWRAVGLFDFEEVVEVLQRVFGMWVIYHTVLKVNDEEI